MDCQSSLYARACKLGTQIRLPDGRVGTTVFNGLCGVGIKWGLHNPPAEDFKNTHGDIGGKPQSPNWPWYADALLRIPWPGVKERTGFSPNQCVGEEFTIIADKDDADQ